MKPFQEFRWQVTKFVTSKRFELEKVLYKRINRFRCMGSRITNSKVFSTAFVWKNKAYKINEIQKTKIAFNPSEIIWI
jgi:hypothetical protein